MSLDTHNFIETGGTTAVLQYILIFDDGVANLSCLPYSQLSQGKEATPIFVPEDGYNWQIAKACFESAEFM